MVRYALEGAAESTPDTDELLDHLDNAFRPSTERLLWGGKRGKNVDSSKEDDGEVIDHDDAHRVFRSPRPSLTLQDLREQEHREHSGDVDSGQGTTSGSAIRGGIFGGSPLDDLWLAQKRDLGGDPGLYAGSATLGAEEAHRAWEEAAREEKYEEEINWRDECVFIDSEAEDITSGDSGCMLR